MINILIFFKKILQSKKYLKRGVTLVETLVATIIFTILIFVIIFSLVSIYKFERHVRNLRNVESSALVVFERITREIKSAVAIDNTQTSYDIELGTLGLTVPNSGGGTKTLEFFVSNGEMHLEENNVDKGQLTLDSSNTDVTRFYLVPISVGGIKGVRIELTIESGTGLYAKSKNFYTTAVVRSNY